MTTPAMTALRKHFKNSMIDCVTNRIGKEVLENQNLADNIYLEDEPINNLYDVAILFKATLRNSLKTKMLKIPIRIGWKREFNSPLLTHSIKTNSRHFIYMNNDLLKPLGIDNISDQMIFNIPDTENRINGNYIVFNPGATTEANRWLSGNFAKLADLIHNKFDYLIIITGVKTDSKIAEEIINQTKERERILNYTGKTSLAELANILKNAKAVIIGDTGPMHLAIAVKSPNVIAIFGPANESLTGPLPKYGTVLAKDKMGNWRNGNPKFENIHVSTVKAGEVFAQLSSM